ncbi:MAG: MBL fold metallo-hydrolase, partial [Planctomycetota bacterium]
ALGPELFLHQADEFLYNHLIEQAAQFRWQVNAPVKIDRFLQDGDRVAFGAAEVSVLHTPGHTPGSVCYHLVTDAPYAGTHILHEFHAMHQGKEKWIAWHADPAQVGHL